MVTETKRPDVSQQRASCTPGPHVCTGTEFASMHREAACCTLDPRWAAPNVTKRDSLNRGPCARVAVVFLDLDTSNYVPDENQHRHD